MSHPSRHIKQLDGVRALAVTLVCIHHWTGSSYSLGIVGVQLFFVLSGFLITGILIRLRDYVISGTQPIRASLRQFYIRRALRIFPLYYGCLILFVVTNSFGIREQAVWHFFYASNILFFIQGEFLGCFPHFWSLAVEEQFYMFWPLLVLLTPASKLPCVIVALIAIAPLTRVAIVLAGGTNYAQYSTLLFANFDTLGMGALAAWWLSTGRCLPRPWILAGRLLVLASALQVFSSRIFHWSGVGVALLDSVAVGVLSTWLVLRCVAGMPGAAGKLFENPFVVYLGTISYGIYVWHMFMPTVLRHLLRTLSLPADLGAGTMGFFVLYALTVLVATISWFAVERPINLLKHKFPYRLQSAAL